MADIKVAVYKKFDLTLFMVKGELTADEVIQSAQPYYEKKPTRLVLWGLAEGSLYKMPSEELRRLATELKKVMYKREGGKTAIVGNFEADFGVGRMYEVFAQRENLPVEYKTFRDRDRALEWLGLDAGIINFDEVEL